MAAKALKPAKKVKAGTSKTASLVAKKEQKKPIPPLHINYQAWDKPAVMAIVCEKIATATRGIKGVLAEGYQGAPLPTLKTVLEWISGDDGLRDQYARAREAQADMMAEEIIAIADEEATTIRADKHSGAKADEDGNVEVVFDSAAVARNRLRVDARKWLASKLAPKKYGDRTTLAGDADNPIAVLTMNQITANPASRIKV